jgi:predicted Zn-dependent peptidase
MSGGRPNGGGEVRKTVLPGGLRVITETVPTVRSATLGIWAHVGSRDETPTLSGATHYLEHLLFKGTRRRSALDISAALDAVGGEMNAFTAKEFTCYYARVLDSDLPLAIDVLGDMLTGSVLDVAEVEAERGVILEEIAMTEDDPGDCVHDLFARALLGDSPLGRPVLGTVETVNGFTRDRLARFYRKHYDPPHLVVAAAGNLDHDTVTRQVRAAFDRAGALERTEGREPVGPRTGARPLRARGRVEIADRSTEQAHLVLGMPGYSRNDDRRWALGVLSAALGGGMSSRLFQEIREKRGLAYSVYSYHSMFAETGLFAVYAGTTPSRARESLSIIRQQLEDVANGGLKNAEIERAKGHMKGALVLSLEDTSGRMSRIGRSEISHGEILSVDEVLERTEAVTREDAERVANEVFERPMALAVIGPFEPDSFSSKPSRANPSRPRNRSAA